MSKNFWIAVGTLLFVALIDLVVVLCGGETVGRFGIGLTVAIVLMINIMDKIDGLKELTHEKR